MAKNLRVGIQRGLRQSIGGGLGTSDIFTLSPASFDFRRTKTKDSRITLTRASSATFVDADGLIKTATTNGARFDHDPTTGKNLGLLVEESRTNLLQQSENFSTTWTRFNVSASVNAITAPDGTTTADKLVENSSNNFHRVRQGISSGVTGTFSIFLKADERTKVNLATSDTNLIAQFDLSTGSVVSGTGSIQSFSNGWYRCSISATFTTSGPFLLLRNASSEFYTGDGTSGVYAWGAQLEADSFPTSYTPTTSSTVTRAADVVKITGTNFSSFYNATEGTIYSEVTFAGIATSGFPRVYQFSDESADLSQHKLSVNVSTAPFRLNASTRISSVGTRASFNSNTVTIGQLVKTAYAYKANDFEVDFSLGSDGASTDTSGAVPTDIDELLIGNRSDGNAPFTGHIKRLTFFSTRLASNTLQSLTS